MTSVKDSIHKLPPGDDVEKIVLTEEGNLIIRNEDKPDELYKGDIVGEKFNEIKNIVQKNIRPPSSVSTKIERVREELLRKAKDSNDVTVAEKGEGPLFNKNDS